MKAHLLRNHSKSQKVQLNSHALTCSWLSSAVAAALAVAHCANHSLHSHVVALQQPSPHYTKVLAHMQHNAVQQQQQPQQSSAYSCRECTAAAAAELPADTHPTYDLKERRRRRCRGAAAGRPATIPAAQISQSVLRDHICAGKTTSI